MKMLALGLLMSLCITAIWLTYRSFSQYSRSQEFAISLIACSTFIGPINTYIFPNYYIWIYSLINPWIPFLKNHFLCKELSKTTTPINWKSLQSIDIICLYSSFLTFHWSKYNKSISNFWLNHASLLMILII